MTKFNLKNISVILIFSSYLLSCEDESKKNELIPEIKFNTEFDYGSVADIEGNQYKTIQIGEQIWMAENLRTSTYNDGTPIQLITKNSEWMNTEQTEEGAYCWYDNNMNTYSNVYGALYNFYAVETNKLCPVGWHVPSKNEWEILYNYLDSSEISSKLKESDTSHWISPNEGATNASGFTALPGGYRYGYFDGHFGNLGNHAAWWSNSSHTSTNAWSFQLNSHPEFIGFWVADIKENGFSVRCLKD